VTLNNVGFFYVLSISDTTPLNFTWEKRGGVGGGAKLYIKKYITNYNVHDNVPPCIWQICKCNLNYDVMKKYPKPKKVDGRFGLLNNKGYF